VFTYRTGFQRQRQTRLAIDGNFVSQFVHSSPEKQDQFISLLNPIYASINKEVCFDPISTGETCVYQITNLTRHHLIKILQGLQDTF
jgi:hypothetical protein